MAYCSNCSSEVTGRFCSICGIETTSRATETSSQGAIDVPVMVHMATAGARPVITRAPTGYASPIVGVPVQSMGSTADNCFTHDAEHLLRATGERIAWQGKPSILSLLPRVIGWSLILLIVLIAAVSSRDSGGAWLLFWLSIAAIHIGAGYLNWTHTTYRITSQRLEYSSGTFSSSTAANPLSQIGNITIVRPFPWNLMHLGHLELDIPDQAVRSRKGFVPKVRLKYLQNLETTRDLIHSSSAIANQLWDQQRFGR